MVSNILECTTQCILPTRYKVGTLMFLFAFSEHINIPEEIISHVPVWFKLYGTSDLWLIYFCLKQKKSLAMFQHDSSCMALLMDGSAALGLDLSFVTHVFLMEPIWDRRLYIKPIHVLSNLRTLVRTLTKTSTLVQFNFLLTWVKPCQYGGASN